MNEDIFTRETVVECDCGSPMLPNISTGDYDGYGWICLNTNCDDYTANEIETEDLIAVGVPGWIAIELAGLIENLIESK